MPDYLTGTLKQLLLKMIQELRANTLEMNTKIDIISKAKENQNKNQIEILELKIKVLKITKLVGWVQGQNRDDKRMNY